MASAALEAFVKKYDDMKQHDQSWYDSFKTTFGGSEMGALMGKSKYGSLAKMVADKRAGKKYVGGYACWWGLLFEGVIKRAVEMDLGSKIIGDQICIRDIPNIRSSPDGYVVLKTYVDEGITRLYTTDMKTQEGVEEGIEKVLSFQERTALLEFKCPITRIPDGKIPKQYKPQLLLGLSLASICDFGLFVDAVFRKCSMYDLVDNPNYDTLYHGTKDYIGVVPYCMGVIAIYAQESDLTLSLKCSETLVDGIIDFGSSLKSTFNQVLQLINEKVFRVVYGEPYFPDGRFEQDEIDIQNFDSHDLIGIIPWKLFHIDYVPIDRDPAFLETIIPIVNNAFDIVNGIAEVVENPLDNLYG